MFTRAVKRGQQVGEISAMKKMIVTSVLGILVAGMVYAEEAPRSATGDYLFDTFSFIRFKRGDMTWSGAGNYSMQMASDGDSAFNFQAGVGYFVTDYVEIEGSATMLSQGDANGVAIALGANRYFREWIDKLYPYVGAGVAMWMQDYEETMGTRLEVKAGVRHYLSPHIGLRYWAQFDSKVDAFDEGVLSAFVGIFSHPY